jgi:hypothetical protein
MRSNRSILQCPAAGFLLFLPGADYSQSSTPPKQPTVNQSQTVLRATTDHVVVDVVVTNDKGLALIDLTMDDFTVLEDGQAQN